ncbi:MAG: DUF2817 domain-containing protein [Elusimicrobia bacterium]|nr:DUF2817 domain-containing protein [Elusimicrobiota bacterium]
MQGRAAIIVPRVNPDGLHMKRRMNAAGVDINRNFPAKNWERKPPGGREWGGSKPQSEPETRMVIRLLRDYRPARIVSIHSPYRSVNYDPPKAKVLAAAMARANGYRLEPNIGYATPGSFGTYAGIEGGIPTVTLELPRSFDKDLIWGENRDALLAALVFR